MTREEPPPAFNLTEVDRQVLAQTDEEFVYHDWEDLKAIIALPLSTTQTSPHSSLSTHSILLIPQSPPSGSRIPELSQLTYDFTPLTSNLTARNDLGILKRKPSDLRRYLAWTAEIKAQYGTITNYICQRRLGWQLPDPDTTNTTGATESGAVFPFKNPIPFADPADYKILRNDWPYGVTSDIAHMVVWLRTPVAVKPENGDITDESRALIEDFVRRTFVARLAREGGHYLNPQEHVLWFKNWTALQSVRSLEHIHVLVRGVSEDILQEWTGEGALKN